MLTSFTIRPRENIDSITIAGTKVKEGPKRTVVFGLSATGLVRKSIAIHEDLNFIRVMTFSLAKLLLGSS